ncbi:MAG: hypothetical protein OXE57_11810 [Alphaproteobacteria bacterium]|nr:hypothetical protein [Alphaproteobacteria bacterium]
MDKSGTSMHRAASDDGLFERLSRRAKRNKSLTAVLAIIFAVVALSSIMALTDSENSQILLAVMFVLVTAGLFCTLGVIFDALDDK